MGMVQPFVKLLIPLSKIAFALDPFHPDQVIEVDDAIPPIIRWVGRLPSTI